MIKKILFLVAFVCINISAFCQEKNDNLTWEQRKQQFKADKIAFISTAMDFTVEEAQAFWPIYNKFDEKLDQIGEKRRLTFDPRKTELSNLSEAQCTNILETSFELDKEELNAKDEFYKELKSRFSSSKILKYYRAEHEFRRKIFCKNGFNGSFGKSYKNN